MIAEWNKSMAEAFSPGWVVCLDESMSIWHSRWTCPGWVFCPRKPHPFGNEYHAIADEDFGIALFGIAHFMKQRIVLHSLERRSEVRRVQLLG